MAEIISHNTPIHRIAPSDHSKSDEAKLNMCTYGFLYNHGDVSTCIKAINGVKVT